MKSRLHQTAESFVDVEEYENQIMYPEFARWAEKAGHPDLPATLLAAALLLTHQPPQIETDRKAGKHSFAVRYGERLTFCVARILLGVFLLAMVGAMVANTYPLALALYAAAVILILVMATKPGLGPKRILFSATGFLSVIFASQLLLH